MMVTIRSVVIYVFLRLYGRALSRPRRNDPENACSDAIMQTSAFLGFIMVSTFWVCAAVIWPPFGKHLSDFDGTFLSATIGLSLLVTFCVRRLVGRYALMPQTANEYREPGMRRMTYTLLVLVPLVWLGV